MMADLMQAAEEWRQAEQRKERALRAFTDADELADAAKARFVRVLSVVTELPLADGIGGLNLQLPRS